MTLLLPIGLLALLALPLIAILHLVRQRRTRVKVPTTALWQALRIPPERRQRTLPLTLLLLLHLLVALCLALALANPALLPWGQHTPTHTVIVLDTTTSMAATDEEPSRFARSQAAAIALLDDLVEGDSVALVELNATPRLLAIGGVADRGRLTAIVRDLAPAGNGADLAAALHIANSTLASEQENQVVVMTDVALSTPAGPLAVAAKLDWRTFGSTAENAAVVAFAARRLPSGETALYARVANFAPNLTVRSLQLLIDGQLYAEDTLRIPAGGSEERVWRIEAGARAELRLIGADALELDDRASLPLERSRSVRVRLISADETALERVLAALPGLDVTVASQFNPAAAPVDVTVLNGVLPDPLPPGALLVVNPPPGDPRLPLAATTLGERASSAPLDPAFAGIDLSSVQWGGRRPLAGELPALQPVITTDQSAALVLRGTLGDQPAVIWSFDVDASNLPAKLGFPLLAAASLDVLTT
ncbi:MAG: VWA domain-containing protein, partial [Herpetosiphonaceae bacterium]|nr:VWA domain-containing protein [Herpetosiphonaceae bacterium]